MSELRKRFEKSFGDLTFIQYEPASDPAERDRRLVESYRQLVRVLLGDTGIREGTDAAVFDFLAAESGESL